MSWLAFQPVAHVDPILNLPLRPSQFLFPPLFRSFDGIVPVACGHRVGRVADLRLAPRRWTQCKACYKRFTPPFVQALCCRFQGPCRSSSNGNERRALGTCCHECSQVVHTPSAFSAWVLQPVRQHPAYAASSFRWSWLPFNEGMCWVFHKTRTHREGEHFDWLHPRCFTFFSLRSDASL